jgi:hypothetical protein
MCRLKHPFGHLPICHGPMMFPFVLSFSGSVIYDLLALTVAFGCANNIAVRGIDGDSTTSHLCLQDVFS